MKVLDYLLDLQVFIQKAEIPMRSAVSCYVHVITEISVIKLPKEKR